jgi:hypothetical protein
MTNIFIKYTASTKRDDNNQTGGFGLGAKTPFSYSDTFSIETNFDGVAYVYSCGIDETRVGKLMLMSERKTTEPNGTEIIIPVKSADFYTFNTSIENATRHWDVKPNFVGGSVSYQIQKKVLEGDNWAFASHDSYQSVVKLIIDGIEYPLDLSTLRTYADATILDSTRSVLLLEFGVGELSLSANREAVYLDDPTKKKIKTRLEYVKSSIKKKLDDKISKFTSLWEANVFYLKELQLVFFDQKFLGPLSWNGIVLSNKYVPMPCPTYHFTKGKYSRKYGTDPDKIVRSIVQSLNFEENSVLFVNDLPLKNPTPKHLKKAFEDNPKAHSIQLICPTDTVTVTELNKTINLDQMKPQLLSSVTKASGRAYTPAANRLLVFKFNGTSFYQVSYASIEEDTNDKVLCITSKDTVYSKTTRVVELKNKKSLKLDAIKSLAQHSPGVSFYCVDEATDETRIEEEFADFTRIDDFIENKITNSKNFDYVQMKYAQGLNYKIDERLVKDEWKVVKKITNPDSLFLRRKDVHTRMKAITEGDLGLLAVYESINGEIATVKVNKWVKDHPECDIDGVNKEYELQYPLLKHLNVYSYTYVSDGLVQYINLIDKEKEEKNV